MAWVSLVFSMTSVWKESSLRHGSPARQNHREKVYLAVVKANQWRKLQVKFAFKLFRPALSSYLLASKTFIGSPGPGRNSPLSSSVILICGKEKNPPNQTQVQYSIILKNNWEKILMCNPCQVSVLKICGYGFRWDWFCYVNLMLTFYRLNPFFDH